MAKLFLLLGLAAVTMAVPYDSYFPPKYEKTPLGESIDRSTMKLLKAAYDVADDKNVVSSPLGLMMLLALFNSGAGPETKEEIIKFLGGTDFKQTSESYEELSNRFASLNPEALTVANKIYVSNQFKLQDSFTRAADKYRSEVDTLDFSKADAAAAIINKWADEKTHGNIKEPVDASMLSPDVAAALFNVIYFKGHWHVPFKAANTMDKDFHASDGNVVKKPTMHLERSLYYAESPELKARLVELPYKEQGFRMVVVLPDEVDGLPAVLEKAATSGLLSDVFKLRPAGAQVHLDLPKFDIKSKLDFNVILPKIGVSKLFNEAATGIVNAPVKVSKAFQEAFIKVDEEGAEAGAFTGLIAVLESSFYSPPEPIFFTVDRPFLYLLLNEDKVIFAGTYTH
ncbi:antichymotrypsin-1-like isoform X6 [Trichoplusia ni]|uniref:Antichymotrypsin-1-like isoform X6 n=1 Tax=Trichoplusia ni TaxID=7111 RepID=A0A7E5WHV3_TRINI|nr:antichymotrypsin-1-like isoform X6 [Trichoplusia ni]XP_026740340.1 antichymotrypsin-1-like isoform X6 [Trichoplusia ni]